MKVVTATRDEDITMEDSVEEVLDVGVLQQVLVVDEGEAELCCECESELQLLLGSGEDAAALQIDHVDVLPVAEGQHHREDLDPSSAAETRSTSRSCDDLDARRPADDDKPPAAAFYSSSSSTTKSRVGAMKRRSACSQSGVCLFLLVIIITTVAILCSLSFLLLGSGGVLSHLGFCAGQEDCVKQKMGIGGGFSESMSHLSQHDHLRHTTGFELETTTNTAATLATPADPVGVDAASSLDCADGHDDCVGHDRSFQREESKFPVIAVQPPTARVSFLLTKTKANENEASNARNQREMGVAAKVALGAVATVSIPLLIVDWVGFEGAGTQILCGLFEAGADGVGDAFHGVGDALHGAGDAVGGWFSADGAGTGDAGGDGINNWWTMNGLNNWGGLLHAGGGEQVEQARQLQNQIEQVMQATAVVGAGAAGAYFAHRRWGTNVPGNDKSQDVSYFETYGQAIQDIGSMPVRVVAEMLPGLPVASNQNEQDRSLQSFFPEAFSFLLQEDTEQIFVWASAVRDGASDEQLEDEKVHSTIGSGLKKDSGELSQIFLKVEDAITKQVQQESSAGTNFLTSVLQHHQDGKMFVAKVLGGWVSSDHGGNCELYDAASTSSCPVHLPPPGPQVLALLRVVRAVFARLLKGQTAGLNWLADAFQLPPATQAKRQEKMFLLLYPFVFEPLMWTKDKQGDKLPGVHVFGGPEGKPKRRRKVSQLTYAALQQFKVEAQEKKTKPSDLCKEQVQNFLREVGVGTPQPRSALPAPPPPAARAAGSLATTPAAPSRSPAAGPVPSLQAPAGSGSAVATTRTPRSFAPGTPGARTQAASRTGGPASGDAAPAVASTTPAPRNDFAAPVGRPAAAVPPAARPAGPPPVAVAGPPPVAAAGAAGAAARGSSGTTPLARGLGTTTLAARGGGSLGTTTLAGGGAGAGSQAAAAGASSPVPSTASPGLASPVSPATPALYPRPRGDAEAVGAAAAAAAPVVPAARPGMTTTTAAGLPPMAVAGPPPVPAAGAAGAAVHGRSGTTPLARGSPGAAPAGGGAGAAASSGLTSPSVPSTASPGVVPPAHARPRRPGAVGAAAAAPVVLGPQEAQRIAANHPPQPQPNANAGGPGQGQGEQALAARPAVPPDENAAVAPPPKDAGEQGGGCNCGEK